MPAGEEELLWSDEEDCAEDLAAFTHQLAALGIDEQAELSGGEEMDVVREDEAAPSPTRRRKMAGGGVAGGSDGPAAGGTAAADLAPLLLAAAAVLRVP
jgi:hypothetical protein